MSPRKALLTFGLALTLTALPVAADDAKSKESGVFAALVAWVVDTFGPGFEPTGFGPGFPPGGFGPGAEPTGFGPGFEPNG